MDVADSDRDVSARPEPASGRRFRAPRHLNVPTWLVVPVLIYATSRAGQLLVLAWMSDGSSVRDRLLAWDGQWFVRVARDGYPHWYSYDERGEMVGNGLAFFPGYPMLVRLAHGVTGLDYGDAALVTSLLAGALAAVVVYLLGSRLYDPRVGAALCALFCAQPMSVALSMVYSEGLFVALAAGALLAAHRKAWLVAGGLGFAAGLTRPTAAALALALAFAAGMEVVRGGARWRPVVGALLALSGVPAYLAWVGLRVGDWKAWFVIQTAGWGSTFDGGAATAHFVVETIRAGDGWVAVSVAFLLLAAVVAAAAAVRMRVWPPLVVYGLLALILVLGQGGYYHSKPRLLVPVLVLLVPAAVALGRARSGTRAAVLVGYSLFGFWYGAHLLTVWRFAV